MNTQNQVKTVWTLAAVVMATLGLTVTSAHAELVLEEQFIYDLGSLIVGQDGGFGFDGPWSASKSHGRDYVMQFEGLTFTEANLQELDVEGNSLSRFGSAGRAEAHRLLSVDSQAALTGDNTTIWFGVLVAAPSAHRWGSFHFGTYKFSTQGMPVLGDGDDDRNPPYTPMDGGGFGFTLMTADSGAGDGTINALAFDDNSVPIVATGTFTQPIQGGATHHDTSLIVGKINWKADGTPDELFLFNVTDLSTEPAEEEAIAAIIDVDLDQSTFDRVGVWDTNNTIFDEIRFGTTFFDAVGIGACPSKLRASGGPGGVTLQWVNGIEMPTSVRVLRDTVEIATAAPVDPPLYTDVGAQPGLIDYELVFTMPGEECEPLTTTFNACITNLLATRTEAGVVLTWTANLRYEGIEIRRDGEVIEASLIDTEQTHTYADPAREGFVSYSVVPTNGTCDPATVEVDMSLVQNRGFEDPVYAGGDYGPATNWSAGFYDVVTDPTTWFPGGDGEDVGAWNPDAADGFSGGAFAGENTGWAVSGVGYDIGLSQVLAATLEEDTEYTLSVQVGNAFYNESDETAPYRIELLAGDVLLATDSDDSPIADTWELHSLTYNSARNPEQVGEPLEIRLLALEYVDGNGDDGYEVDFDEVTLTISSDPQEPSFVRGDANSDSQINITDAIFLLSSLFLGGPNPTCADAADANDDAAVNITDAIYLLSSLFLGGPPPPPPTGQAPGDCDEDPTADALDCVSFEPCE